MGPFKALPFCDWDKEIIIANNELRLSVDYDDVDHKEVKKAVKEMLVRLNDYPALKKKYDELKFRMDGLEK